MSAASRRAALLRLVAEQPGPVRTGQAWKHLRTLGLAPKRRTARLDLERMVAEGLLCHTGPDSARAYLPAAREGGAA